MTEADKLLEARVQILEHQVRVLEKSIDVLGDDMRYVRRKVGEIEAGAKMLRWIIGIGAALGPTIGVLIVKIMGGT